MPPPAMQNRRSQLSAFSYGIPPDSPQLSIHFDRVSVVSNQLQPMSINSPFFARQKKKDFPFFPGGATSSRTVPKTQPLQVAFALRERVDLRSQKREGFGEENCLGKGGADRAKKRKKGCTKKGGSMSVSLTRHSVKKTQELY